jgi:hypothetical protein
VLLAVPALLHFPFSTLRTVTAIRELQARITNAIDDLVALATINRVTDVINFGDVEILEIDLNRTMTIRLAGRGRHIFYLDSIQQGRVE